MLVFQIRGFHAGNGPGHHALLLGAVAHDHHFLQSLNIGNHRDIEQLPTVQFDGFGDEADVRKHQCLHVVADIEIVFSVHVRDGSLHGAFGHDTHARQRLTVFLIRYLAAYRLQDFDWRNPFVGFDLA